MAELIGEKTRILLTDDHHVVRQGIRGLLERETDFEVIGEADNGLDALKLAHELRPDVIVLESRMPKLETIEIIKRAKAEYPVAVLILTYFNEDDHIIELLTAGADGYLLMSTRIEELVRAIRVVHNGEFICDPLIQKRLLKHAATPRPVALDCGEHLTIRETEILKLAAKGLSNRDIAAYLGITERTVKGHLVNIFGKMQVNSRTGAVLEALKRGWASLEDI